MYDWILEADIYRFRKALLDTPKGTARDQLIVKLHDTEDRLAASKAAAGGKAVQATMRS